MDNPGDKYNNLTLIKRLKVKDNRNSVWFCRCDCGNKKAFILNNIKRGKTKSCGCKRAELVSLKVSTHGFISKYKKDNKNPRFYGIWSGMKNRCCNNSNNSYKYYGGKGIKVCKRWYSFNNFYDDMWESYNYACKNIGTKNTSIDRIDNKKGYNLKNCRWVDIKTQARNKSNNNILSYNGHKMCASEIIEKYNINKHKFYRRLKKQIPIKEIIEELAYPVLIDD